MERMWIRFKNILRQCPKYLCLSAAAVVMLFPFFWMLMTAMKTRQELAVYPPALFPETLNLNNFVTVLEHSSLGIYFLNSAIVAVVQTVIVVFITTITAYGFYRYRFAGKKALFYVLLMLNVLPFAVVMLFNYRMMIQMGLNNTLIALVIPFCFKFFYVYILYNAFCSIPQSLYIAACLDKASDMKFLFRIALPVVRPTIVYISIMNIVSSWNSFIWPLLITNSVETRTLPFGIYTYMSETGSDQSLVMAFSALSQFPLVIMLIALRKQFVNGHKSHYRSQM